MQHLLNLLSGMGRLGSVFAPRDYPTYQGFAQDARNMRSDWRAMGADMRTALKKEAQTRPTGRGQ